MRTSRFFIYWSLALGLTAACGPKDRLKSDLTDNSVWPVLSATPGEGLKTIAWPKQQNVEGTGAVLTDILSHLPASYGNTYYDADKITWGHETSHGIHAHLRSHKNDTAHTANAFYLLNDKAAVVIEPKMSKATIAAYVPANLRGSRFGMYITGQTSWDDTPLYVLDEFNAYVNGGAVGVDLVKNDLWVGENRDAVEGQIEFTVYALALGLAVRQYDPEYFASYPQFAEFLAFNIARSMKIFRAGAIMTPFKRDAQEKYFEAFRTSDEAAPLRWFASRLFGEKWTQDVLLAPIVIADLNPPSQPKPPTQPNQPPQPIEPNNPDVPTDPTPVDPDPTPVDPDPTPTDPDPTPTDPDPIPDEPVDTDGDGVIDEQDLCSNTPAGAVAWKYGPWIGCSAGQHRD